MKMKKWFFVTGLVILALLMVFLFFDRRSNEFVSARLLIPATGTPAGLQVNGFARVTGPHEFDPQQDFGSHPDYQTEWWYYTGNLDTPQGRHFGYQLTFFRRALLPPDKFPARSSDWATDQVYMAHFAVTDVKGNEHQAFERLSRGAAGLAGARPDPYQVWLEDWQVEQIGDGKYHLVAAQSGLQLDLTLVDGKGPILQGQNGYSQKGPDPGNSSFYFSQTHLETAGTLAIGGEQFSVEGLSWMDHEYSTSALLKGQVGWDWFALQLSDGSELMVYQIRQADGQVDPFSSGTVVYPDGTTRSLKKADFKITVLDTWKSPVSHATYPSRWQVDIPADSLSLVIEPYIPDQELDLRYTYWEGAVKIQGTVGGRAVSGSGYVELTGYGGSMAGEF